MNYVKNVDFKYCLEYDYDTDRSSCDCGSICRCSKIYNARVTEVNINYILDNIKNNNKIKKEDLYFVDRILRINKIYETEIWDISITGGYYGEEVDEIKLDNKIADKIDSDLNKVFNFKSFRKRIESVLEKEYGYLLESLKDKKYSVETISKSNIYLPQREYVKKLDKSEYYKNYNLFKAIVIPDGSKYRVIDGYHRVLACNKEELEVIVAI